MQCSYFTWCTHAVFSQSCLINLFMSIVLALKLLQGETKWSIKFGVFVAVPIIIANHVMNYWNNLRKDESERQSIEFRQRIMRRFNFIQRSQDLPKQDAGG